MKLVLYLFIALITILSCGEKQEEKEKPSKENSFSSKAKIVRNQNKPKDAEQVFLRFAPVEGTSKKMKLEMNSEFAGQEMDIFMSMEQFFIKKHDNGDVDSKANYSDFRMQLMGRTITMDDNPELRELGKSRSSPDLIFSTHTNRRCACVWPADPVLDYKDVEDGSAG